MAEINNSFFQGKMNKDLDERLIPNGQYRDALNIEVSTSDDNDVGTVQAVRGNSKVSGTDSVPANSSIVGEITDEKNNCIYYFVSGPQANVSAFSSSDAQPTVSRDLILKYDSVTGSMTNVFTDIYSYLATFEQSGTNLAFNVGTQTITVPNSTAFTLNLSTNMYVNVFDTSGTNYVWNNRIVSISSSGRTMTLENQINSLNGVSTTDLVLHITHKDEKRALNFNSSYYITGINIVEDFLIWTDNNSEPKKISISRSIAGTTDSNTQTKLYIDGGASYPLTTDKKVDETHTTVIRKSPINSVSVEVKTSRSNITNKSTDTLNMSGVNEDDIIEVTVTDNPFLPNDVLHLDTGVPSAVDHQVRLRVLSLIGETGFLAKVISKDVSSSSVFNIFLFDEEKPLFKDKFSFFATRWKYIDGEYSTFSPFSEAAFLPSTFVYDKKASFNKGMDNTLKEVKLTNIVPSGIPEDVVQVDILYTESNNPEIYKVDSVRKDSTNDSYWDDNEYVITKENIYSLLEEKQLLRQWDNVPKKALAQEIVGNRLIYANYEQNYELENQNIDLEAFVDTRVFTGPELIPNPHISENHEGWGFNSLAWAHQRTKTDNNRTPGSFNLQTGANQYQKLFTTTSLSLEPEQGAQYYYSFTVSDSDGVFSIQGPNVMSGDGSGANEGYFSTEAPSVSGDGDYSGVVTLDTIRSSSGSTFQTNTHSNNRHVMFQKSSIATTTGTCKISNFSLKKVITNKKQSVKSLRNYKLGVVYADEYGRETPVLTSKNASINIDKRRSSNINCIKSKIISDAPNWATHFKYFVKETSSDYNNLALDRIYRSGDNAFWLSFPSAERNKVDEDDFLILKRGHGEVGNIIETDEARYKVLDISANAPDFIKQTKISVGVGGPTSGINNLFDQGGGRPFINENRITFDKSEWVVSDQNNNLVPIFATKELAYEFKDNNNRVSRLYKVESLSIVDVGTGSDHYEIISTNKFTEEDLSWIMTGSSLSSGVTIEFFSVQVENRPEFDGRFFVKVNQDQHILTNVYTNSANNILDQIVANVDSLFKMDSANTLGLLKEYDDTSGGLLITQNSFATADDATNVMSIADNTGSLTDLTSSSFLSYDGSTSPFPNLPANDTLYYEARPWFESGDSFGSGTQQAGDGKNIYKAIPEQLALATLHVDFTSGNTHFNKAQVGTSGISDNIVGVGQVSKISSSGTTAGILKHAAFSYSYGLYQSIDNTGNNYSIYGSVGAYMKFLRIFKFGVGTTSDDLGITGEFSGKWFIDNMSYIGLQRDGSYHPGDGIYLHYHRAVHYDATNSNTLEMAAMDGTPFGHANQINLANNDFLRMGRGIYTATQDDRDADTVLYGTGNEFHEVGSHYMQLSFGGIKRTNDIAHTNFALGSEWSAKGWVSDEAAFQNLVDKFEVGMRFKFADDSSNEVFTVLDFKRVQRYNHTPFPGNGYTYSQWFDGGLININFGMLRNNSNSIEFRARPTHNGTGNFAQHRVGDSNVTIVQDSITDEEKRFVRGTNRRLTYILKLDKKPGQGGLFNPLNTSGVLNTTGLMDGNNSRIIEVIDDVINETTQLTTDKPAIFETEPKTTEGLDIYYEASDFIDIKDHGITNRLSYFNCYSFENGVESNRIKDVFNKPSLGKGIVASTTLDEVYKQDRRGSGLIFSGIYNSTSNVNDLNQFLTAEIITKDINPTYGTIQKLHTRDSNLLVLCEDKILKILANKDAVFNADGNIQLTANTNVLGQTIPYVGEYGISKDPRSFASQSHRSYFTDKQRGVVIRLSMDGLTPISQYGMADFFRDNLPISTNLIGSYDARKNEYNLRLDTAGTDYVISFNENIKGFSSFKSFNSMEAGVSLNNNYYTFKNAELYKHHINDLRAHFYGVQYYPELTLVLNADPYKNKRFKTIIYEGTQAKVDLLDVTSDGSDADFYNIEAKTGWYVDDLETDIPQTGSINEFLEKGNKWYNYIKGDAVTASNIDTSDFNVQGLGIITSNTVSS